MSIRGHDVDPLISAAARAYLDSARGPWIIPETVISGAAVARVVIPAAIHASSLSFPSVVAAVECAMAVQELMAKRNVDAPDDRRMQFRIGVNLGDVLVEGDDILGDGVNVAARLEGAAVGALPFSHTRDTPCK
jgi:class 3 adenylate cyclase